MKQITCPKCNKAFRTIFYCLTICETKFNTSTKQDPAYNTYGRYERNPHLRWETIDYGENYAFRPGAKEFKENTIGFYCDSCHYVFPTSLNQLIFQYIDNKHLLTKLTKDK